MRMYTQCLDYVTYAVISLLLAKLFISLKRTVVGRGEAHNICYSSYFDIIHVLDKASLT